MFKVGAGKAGFVRGLLLAGSASAALCLPGAAFAQDDEAAAAAADGDAYAAEEDSSSGNAILVTAQRREQALQDVTASVVAIGADRLDEAQINNLQDLQTIVPSVNFGNDFNQAKIWS